MEFCGISTEDNSWSTAFLQMSALELCLCFKSSCPGKWVPVPVACRKKSCCTWCRKMVNSLVMISGVNKWKLITKNVFLLSRRIACVKWHCWLTGNVRQSSTVIWFDFLKFIWIIQNSFALSFIVFVKWASVFVSWPSLNFCTENSSTRNSWALFFFPSHGYFLSEFFEELFPL